MRSRLLASLVAALVTFPATTSAEDLVLDWADHARGREELAGDPVFQRNLVCWTPGQREVCMLTVITIGRNQCPVLLSANAWRTDTGELKASRTESTVDLEFQGVSLGGPTHWKLHLKVRRSARNSPIVERASGVIVTAPLRREDGARSTDLVAFAKATTGIDAREWADVELNCPRIAVVAAKTAAK